MRQDWGCAAALAAARIEDPIFGCPWRAPVVVRGARESSRQLKATACRRPQLQSAWPEAPEIGGSTRLGGHGK